MHIVRRSVLPGKINGTYRKSRPLYYTHTQFPRYYICNFRCTYMYWGQPKKRRCGRKDRRRLSGRRDGCGRAWRRATCTHYTLQPGTQKFLNPRTGRAPVSRVLIGWPCGLKLQLPGHSGQLQLQTVCTADQNSRNWSAPRSGVLYHFMGACGRAGAGPPQDVIPRSAPDPAWLSERCERYACRKFRAVTSTADFGRHSLRDSDAQRLLHSQNFRVAMAH
eukprot:SAG25_NODE_558_length_6927_cov_5.344171_6_plen_220_part_00